MGEGTGHIRSGRSEKGGGQRDNCKRSSWGCSGVWWYSSMEGCLAGVKTGVMWMKDRGMLWTKAALEVHCLGELKLEKKSLCRCPRDWQRWGRAAEEEHDEWCGGRGEHNKCHRLQVRRECEDRWLTTINLWFLWYGCVSLTVWTYMAQWIGTYLFFHFLKHSLHVTSIPDTREWDTVLTLRELIIYWVWKYFSVINARERNR